MSKLMVWEMKQDAETGEDYVEITQGEKVVTFRRHQVVPLLMTIQQAVVRWVNEVKS